MASARVRCGVGGDAGAVVGAGAEGDGGDGWEGLAQPITVIANTATSIQKSILALLPKISMDNLLNGKVRFMGEVEYLG